MLRVTNMFGFQLNMIFLYNLVKRRVFSILKTPGPSDK